MPNGVPFGNIFEVKSPATDRLTERIYREERQRELYRQQQSRMLDDEFARNMSGIRDSDIGDLTKAYGDYKLSYQNTLKKRGGVSPDEQLAVLRKKAAIYDIINKSKQEKAWEDMQSKQITTDKKGIYADDAAEQLRVRRSKPLGKLNVEEDKKLLYPYSVPDLAKEIKTAEGTEREVPITIGVSKIDPLKDDKEVYKVKNNPSVFAGKLLEQIVATNKTRNFAGIYNNKYDEQELEDLKNKYYAKVNDPKFQAIYGTVDPLPATDTDLGKAVAIRTMEEYANLDLKPTKLISEVNQDRAMTRRQQFAKEQQARAHQNSLSRLFVYTNIQDRKPETIGRNIDALIAQHIEDARANNGEVVTDNATFESITGKKKTGSSVLMFDEANNKYTYGTKDATTGEVKIAGEVPVDLGRIKLTKTYKTGLDSKYNTGKEIKVAPGTYLIKGKKYSEAELIKMGYTVDQIKPYKQ
jgi:hypothetical protein